MKTEKQTIEQILKLLEGRSYPETKRLLQEVNRWVEVWSTFRINKPELFRKQFDASYPDRLEESEEGSLNQ